MKLTRRITGALMAIVALSVAAAESPMKSQGDDSVPLLSKKQAATEERSIGKKPTGLPWLSRLADGYTQARQRSQPIVVLFVSEHCFWCEALNKEIATADVQKELARWTLVALDVDKHPKEARSLAAGATPALRLLTPTGRLVASQDGHLPAAKLVTWLKRHYEAAAGKAAQELVESGVPTGAAVARLLHHLKQRDPVLREAAGRRLLAHPQVAAEPVAESFAQGALQVRLAALELLREWKAPIDGLDPWRPETVTARRLESLRTWAVEAGRIASAKPEPLTPAQVRAVRQSMVRMLGADDAEAAAIRERLAYHRRALLPQVYEQLKEAVTDQARERLLALRYRLVASDALVLVWPGGLERLASTDASTRQRAAQALANRVTASEEALLLELFSNPDPLVREISLRALQSISDSRSSAALVQLLSDPEPNVRAAVLKQLAEQPTPGLIAKIGEYVRREKDPDLLVHAVRVLKSTPSKAAVECLRGLLGHTSWRVRAEAAEALGQRVAHRSEGSEELRADICAALIQLLEDDDGFVVSRAVNALQATDLAVAVEPLAEAARKHPELTAEIVAALAHGSNMRAKAIPHLQRFGRHETPEVRAAAVTGLCLAAPADAEPHLKAALQDQASKVRQAAATALLGLLEDQRPNRRHDRDDHTVDWDVWLDEFRAGKHRPKWIAGLVELLRPMLTAAAPEERLSAAIPLIALTQDEKVIPAVVGVASATANLQGKAAEALAWLPWSKRLVLWQQLTALDPKPDELVEMIRAMGRIPDARAAAPLWAAAATDKVHGELASALVSALRSIYLGESNSALRASSEANRKELLQAAKPWVETGPEMQRLVALVLLLAASTDAAQEAAEKVFNDARASRELRQDAFRVILLSQSKATSQQRALATLNQTDPDLRKLALRFLALGPNAIQQLRGEQIYLVVNNPELLDRSTPHGQPIAPEVPAGLNAEAVRPLLHDRDPQVSAYAGYLLTLVGDSEGLVPLLHYWRGRERSDDNWLKLVYRAVAALNDDNRVPLLEEIYRILLDDYNLREFYWTIRTMSGSNALKLRKQIRAEVGMDRLR